MTLANRFTVVRVAARLRSRAGAIFLLGSLLACSSQQAYNAGQAWQRQECNKINDAVNRRFKRPFSGPLPGRTPDLTLALRSLGSTAAR